jgi:hypothetical protein
MHSQHLTSSQIRFYCIITIINPESFFLLKDSICQLKVKTHQKIKLGFFEVSYEIRVLDLVLLFFNS